MAADGATLSPLKALRRLIIAVACAWVAAGIVLLFIEFVGIWAVMRYAPDRDPFFILKSAPGQLATVFLFAALLGLFYKIIAGTKAVVWPIWVACAALVVFLADWLVNFYRPTVEVVRNSDGTRAAPAGFADMMLSVAVIALVVSLILVGARRLARVTA